MLLTEEALRMLEASGVPWGLEQRSKHVGLRVAGKLVAVVSHSRKRTPGPDGYKNVVSAVRRRLRELGIASGRMNG